MIFGCPILNRASPATASAARREVRQGDASPTIGNLGGYVAPCVLGPAREATGRRDFGLFVMSAAIFGALLVHFLPRNVSIDEAEQATVLAEHRAVGATQKSKEYLPPLSRSAVRKGLRSKSPENGSDGATGVRENLDSGPAVPVSSSPSSSSSRRCGCFFAYPHRSMAGRRR
jgi:hypothetical protein